MKIAVICDPIDLDNKAGIPVYCENVVRQLLLDDRHDYVFYHSVPSPLLCGHEEAIFPVSSRPGIVRALQMVWRKFVLMPLDFRKRGVNVVHELNSIGPYIFDPFRKYRSVVTIFDLTPLIFPKLHGFLNSVGFRLFLWLSISRADKVIAISEATKRDIVTHYGTNPSKIAVTLLASNLDGESPDPKFSFDFPYVLSVWTLEPRKNLKNLVKAFVMAKESGRLKGVKLVLTGKIWWKTDSLFEELRMHSEFSKDIVRTGFVTNGQLAHLYRNSLVFAYPSLYEGFWLPVLEAMSFWTPVLTSSVSSLPEVAWDACLMVDPLDVPSISEWLAFLSESSDLRKTLSGKGLERIRLFTWKKCVEDTLATYESLNDH